MVQAIDSAIASAIASRNSHIESDVKFIGGEDVIISAGLAGETTPANFYAIGLTNSLSMNDGRPAPTAGEMGSNSTITMIGDSAKSLGMNRILIKGMSLPYALYYPQYKAFGNTDFRLIDKVVSDGFDASVEKDYGADDIAGGPDILLGVLDISSPGEYSDKIAAIAANMRLVGLVQGIQVSSSMPIRQISEMGSHGKYIYGGKADKNIAISRILTESRSVLSMLYNEDGIANDLQLATYKKPIYPVLVIMGKNANGDDEVNSYILLEKAIVANTGRMGSAGEQAIVENLSFSWNNTKYIGGDNTNTKNTTGSDMKNSNVWIDLDRDIFRQPFNLLLTYMKTNAVGNRVILAQQILNNAYMSNIGRMFTAGAYSTIEDAGISWENTVDVPLD